MGTPQHPFTVDWEGVQSPLHEPTRSPTTIVPALRLSGSLPLLNSLRPVIQQIEPNVVIGLREGSTKTRNALFLADVKTPLTEFLNLLASRAGLPATHLAELSVTPQLVVQFTVQSGRINDAERALRETCAFALAVGGNLYIWELADRAKTDVQGLALQSLEKTGCVVSLATPIVESVDVLQFTVTGLSCGSCCAKVEGAVSPLGAVESSKMDFERKLLRVRLNKNAPIDDARKLILATVQGLGYTITPRQVHHAFYYVGGMHCGNCAEFIETHLKEGNKGSFLVDGLLSATCDFPTKILKIDIADDVDVGHVATFVQDALIAKKFTIDRRMADEFVLNVTGMRCCSCAGKIKKAMQDLGAYQTSVDVKTGRVATSFARPVPPPPPEGAAEDPLLGLAGGRDVGAENVNKLQGAIQQSISALGFGVTLEETRANVSGWHEAEDVAQVVEKAPPRARVTFKGGIGGGTSAFDNANAGLATSSTFNGFLASPGGGQPPPLSPTTPTSRQAVSFMVSGMSCASCASKVETALKKAPGVRSATVNFATNTARVIFDSSEADSRDFINLANRLGFPSSLSSSASHRAELAASLRRQEETQYYMRRFLVSLFFSIPLLIMEFAVNNRSARNALHTTVVKELPVMAIIGFVLSTPVLVYCGSGFYKNAYNALKFFTFNMDVLVALGVSSAYIGSVFYMILTLMDITHHAQYFFNTAAVLITFMLLGKMLESVAKRKTSDALLALLNLQPKTAVLVRGPVESPFSEEVVDVSTIVHEDVVKVMQGCRVPADGEIVHGVASIDQSMVTGESVPVHKTVGDEVLGGTLNTDGLIFVKVTRLGEESTLAQILRLVEEAQNVKAPIQGYADHISSKFVPVVISLAILTFVLWWALGAAGAYPIKWRMEPGWEKTEACRNIVQFHATHQEPSIPIDLIHQCHELQSSMVVALRFFIAMLVVACPCAMGLATPTAVMVGTGRGSQIGVLIKSGLVLEFASKVGTVLFDKTGTLTEGRMTVSDAEFKATQHSRADVLLSIAAAESISAHPIARAVVGHCDQLLWSLFPNTPKNPSSTGFPLPTPAATESVPGRGVSAAIDWPPSGRHTSPMSPSSGRNKTVLVGSLAFVKERCEVPSTYTTKIAALQDDGKTVVLAAIDNEVVALFGLSDTVKEEAHKVVELLQRRCKVQVGMVTGDNHRASRALARRLGIPQDNVFSEVLPHQKAAIVEQCQERPRGAPLNQRDIEGGNVRGTQRYRTLGHALSIVAFVGDGINDAPALSQSDVGIAMGSGTEVAMETSDIVLMHNDLRDVLACIDLARATFRRIQANFVWAFGYNVVAIPIAAGVLFPVNQFQLPPIAAGMSMICSSLLVLACSLSLKLWSKPL